MSDKLSGMNNALLRRLALLAVAMFGFGFLLVPLYNVFCDITGIGGKIDISAPAVVEAQDVDADRIVTIEFVTTLNQQAPWEFRPTVASMQVHPGEFYDTTFFARNLTDRELVAQAIPSIAPGEVAKYLKKTECFCFTQQDFAPQEAKDMPVRFVIDPDIPKHVDRLTLSYTFFAIPKQKVATADTATTRQ